MAANAECLVEAGVDWITLTAAGDHERLGLGVLARKQVRLIAEAGNEATPWSFSGYQGFRTRGLQYGERFDTTIVRLSSECARDNWWEFYQVAENCSRVDWQVTHRNDVHPYRRVMDHHKQARKHWAKRKDGPTITLVCDDRQGATLYLGKRSSHIMLRCYNKHAESGLDYYSGCVRYEVELKDKAARNLMVELTSGVMERAALIASVHEMFRVRGVVPP